MSKFFAIIAFAVALPMSNPAHAYIKCDKIDNAGKKKKCEKKTAKAIAKKRKGTTAFKPSQIGKQFAYLDGKNPLDSDDFYLGVKTTGIKDVDAISNQAVKMAAIIKLTKYTAHLNKSDKAAASKLGGLLLPELKNLQKEGEELQKKIGELDPASLASSPMDIPKAAGALLKSTGTVVQAIGDVPGALKAIGPIAKGAAAGAAAGAMDKVKGATDAAKGAADQAKDAADAAKKATGK